MIRCSLSYILTFTLFSFLTSTASAEYRVYQYIIKNKVQTANDQPTSSVIKTTLDPRSYIAYNGGTNLISADLLRTWICPGSTSGFKKLCKSPYQKLPEGLLK